MSAYRTFSIFGMTFLVNSSPKLDLYVVRMNFESILMPIEALTSIIYFPDVYKKLVT